MNTKHLDPVAYLDYCTKQIKYLAKLCLKCGIRFKDVSGLCKECKEEARSK